MQCFAEWSPVDSEKTCSEIKPIEQRTFFYLQFEGVKLNKLRYYS